MPSPSPNQQCQYTNTNIKNNDYIASVMAQLLWDITQFIW